MNPQPFDLPDVSPDYYDTAAEGGIQLSFFAPSFWVINGSPDFEEIGGVKYFGGWMCEAKIIREGIEAEKAAGMSAWNRAFPVPGHRIIWHTPDKGARTEYSSTRMLAIAPFARRGWSVDKVTGQRCKPFTKGASPRVQVLALMGYTVEKKFQVWGPILLKARGWQVSHLTAAIDANLTKYQEALAQFYPGQKIQPNLFWQFVGTFGEEPDFKSTPGRDGKDGKIITPITGWSPDKITAETLQQRYVGREAVETMIELKALAAEWLANAYVKDEDAPPAPKNAPAMSAPPEPPAPNDLDPFPL